ncbi:hypothetical protein Tco_1386883, partial [Tanacetum coccineum]
PFSAKVHDIMDREVKCLKQSRILIVKVRWNSKRGHEFTWERENQMQKKYPHLFTNSAPAAETDTPASPDYSPPYDSESDPSEDPYNQPIPPVTATSPSYHRMSPMTSVPALSSVSGALSPVRADLIPSPKRVRDSGCLAEVEVDPRETSWRDDVIAEIDECFAYADALRDRGIDARVVVETIDRDETEMGVRGPVEVRVERVTHPVMPQDIPEPAQEGSVEVTYETLGDLVQRFHDHTEAIPVHRIQTIEGVQREQGHRIVGVESAVMALTERLVVLERDNRRLRGTMSVESQRVDRLQRGMLRMQRELRQMRRLRFYDRVRVGRLEACARKHMGYRSKEQSSDDHQADKERSMDNNGENNTNATSLATANANPDFVSNNASSSIYTNSVNMDSYAKAVGINGRIGDRGK